MKATVTQVLNISFKFRKELRKYKQGNQTAPQIETIAPALNIFDKFEIQVLKDEVFRKDFLNWLQKGSTIELRELAKKVGFDYWSNLKNANAIDTLDSVKANFKF